MESIVENAEERPRWQEEDSARFIDLGRIYTPRRDELLTAFLDLIPAAEDAVFTGVELGTGAGWLTEGILRRYPNATMIGLDGSEAMRRETAARLAPFGARAAIRPFRLEEQAWLEALPDPLHLVVSSLVIHHLDGPGKQRLFADLCARLAAGGALLICDVVEPANGWGRRHMARAWDAEVARQSVEIGGDRSAYEHFLADRWNMYEYPVGDDDIDMPSPLVDQLRWLGEAGFTGVDAWWVRAGHALFGGYRESTGDGRRATDGETEGR
jgi:tRNA (cmo5U34)-methyltransferase